MNKDIENYNNKRELHGYQERYYGDGLKLGCRGNTKNGLDIGYQEYHIIKETEYYIR